MSGITRAFDCARSEDRAAVIPYLMAGYPNGVDSTDLALALEASGADILEIGMPFSDPLADGPTIQRAATRSLESGTTVATCLATVARIRERSQIPLALMGYYNPVLRYGLDRFAANASAAGVEGLILPDLPPEEATEMRKVARRHGIDLIFLVAPTSTEARLRSAARVAGGFIYCVSLTGVTGARAAVAAGLGEFLARVRAHTPLPLAVGFGISKPEHVRQVGQVADGVVVASALIELLERSAPGERLQAAQEYVRSLRSAAERTAKV